MQLPDGVPKWAPAFIAVFMAGFLYCGFYGEEAWPLTGWRLFSRIRTDEQMSWSVTWVDSKNQSRPYPFKELPFAYGGYVHVLNRFPRETPSDQLRICRAWLEAIRDEHPKALTISRTTWKLSERSGRRAKPPKTEDTYTCDGTSVRVKGSGA